MKFMSDYLQRELEFSTIQEVDEASGEPIHIIPHESLVSLAKELNLSISDRVIYAGPNEAVMSCTISDGTKSVSWIGESNPETLDNEIKKKFRFTMAWNQAFDRALIIFLQIPDRRIKSDMEMDINPANKQELGPQVSGNNPYAQKNNKAPAPAPVNNKPVQSAKPVQQTQKPQQAKHNADTGEPSAEGDANTLIDFGKYSGNPQLIKSVYKHDWEFLRWVYADSISEQPRLEVPDDKIWQVEAACRYFYYMQNMKK